MCSDENGAPHAITYLNAQFAALHQNAERCLREHEPDRTEDNQRFYALAQFQVQGTGFTDYAFRTRFKQPELEFVCNHDAILHITLVDATLVLESLRVGSSGEVVGLPDDLRLSYRVGFETRTISGQDQKIGGNNNKIQLLILKIREATFLSSWPEVNKGRDMLLTYMKDYFEVLYKAGNHVLFSLPQFDQTASPMSINYSLNGMTEYFNRAIHGVSTKDVNSYLSSLWMKSAMLVDNDVTRSETDWRARSLAEFSTTSLKTDSYGHFRMELGPPRINILCDQEVLIYFDVDTVEFSNADSFDEPSSTRQYRSWTIAMVANVVYSNQREGQIVSIALDLTQPFHHHEDASDYPGLPEYDDAAEEEWNSLISFFSVEYLRILESAQYHILYLHDSRLASSQKATSTLQEEADGSWWALEMSNATGASSREVVQRTKMFGFDQVIAVSQDSINAQFSALSANSRSLFHHWSNGESFSTTFRPMSIRLLSNNRAIIWVHLQKGSVLTLADETKHKPGGKKHEFGDWRLAFEVELKMCSEDEPLEGVSSDAYKATAAYQDHKRAENATADSELRHIFLDLRHAEHLHEYSAYGDTATTADSRSLIDRLQAVVHYTKEYFAAICQDALHVISTVPVWKSKSDETEETEQADETDTTRTKKSKASRSHALTSVGFQVYTKVEINRHNWAHVTDGQEPILVLFGMTEGSLVSQRLEYSTGWIVQGSKGFSHGTIGISKRVLWEGRLFGLLDSVNRLTTLIPKPPNGFSSISLVPWSDHDDYKGSNTPWVPLPRDAKGCLKFLWENCTEWKHSQKGNGAMMEGEHAVSCTTRNYVELPTKVEKGAIHIKIGGEVDLSLSLHTDRLYEARASVSWSTAITLQTVGSGITVTTHGSHDPVFTNSEYAEGTAEYKIRDPAKMLKEVFPKRVDLDDLVKEFKAFEGTWQYCYPLSNAYSLASPVFNDDGDLLFELRRHGTSSVHAPVASNGAQGMPRRRRRRVPGGPEMRPPSGTKTPSSDSHSA